MEFVGQAHTVNEHLLEILYKHGAIIIQAPDMYGKTYFCKKLAEHFKLGYIVVNPAVDDIEELQFGIKSGYLYHIKDFHNASKQATRRVLKLLEESIPVGAMVILTVEPPYYDYTITSRCIKIKFKQYSKEDLVTFFGDNVNIDDLCLIYDTPTKILSLTETDIANFDSSKKLVCDMLTLLSKFVGNEDGYLRDTINEVCRLHYTYIYIVSRGWYMKNNVRFPSNIVCLYNKLHDNDKLAHWYKAKLIVRGIINDLIRV